MSYPSTHTNETDELKASISDLKTRIAEFVKDCPSTCYDLRKERKKTRKALEKVIDFHDARCTGCPIMHRDLKPVAPTCDFEDEGRCWFQELYTILTTDDDIV